MDGIPGRRTENTETVTLILNLFALTEQKIEKIVRENIELKQIISSCKVDNSNLQESLKLLEKENQAIKRVNLSYEASAKCWKELEAQHRELNSLYQKKEQDASNKEKKDQFYFSSTVESLKNEAQDKVNKLNAELIKVVEENFQLTRSLEDINAKHSKALAELKLEHERKCFMIQAESAKNNTANESSRLFRSFQKKLEYATNEYERKLTAVREENKELQNKLKEKSLSKSSEVSPAKRLITSSKNENLSTGHSKRVKDAKAITINLPCPPDLPPCKGNGAASTNKKSIPINSPCTENSCIEASDNESV